MKNTIPGFFKNTTPAPADFDRECSNRLATAIRQNNPLAKFRFNENKWAAEFAALRKAGYEKNRIRKALEFFIQNIRAEYTPVIFSAAGFRKKFLQIEAAARRPVAPKKIQITDAAQNLQRSLGYLQWPSEKETKAELSFLQLSWDRYTGFLAALESLYIRESAYAEHTLHYDGDVKSSDLEFSYLLHHLVFSAADPVEYVAAWARRVHRMAWEWDGWHGNLLRAAWYPTAPVFVKSMRAAIREYGAGIGEWERILEKIEQ
jgi:hypothetical protein